MMGTKSRLGRSWAEIKRTRPIDTARVEAIKAEMRKELASN
ncbi:hypothetical protein [Gordonia malaquae]